MQTISATQQVCGLRSRAAAFSVRKQQTARRSPMLVRAQEQPESEVPDRSLDFTSNLRARRGFTDQDSAGQTNIFAVEPKAYVQGSAKDTTEDQTSVYVGAAVLGGVIIAAALLLLKIDAPEPVEDPSTYAPLSSYRTKFAAASPPSAPALSE